MAMKASHPPTPAGRRTLTVDRTAAGGGPVKASRNEEGKEDRELKGKKGKGLYHIL